MSIKIMSEVWEHATVDGGALLVLLTLADSADEATRSCYPGVESIAAKARLSERQVQYCLKRLRESGIIEVKRCASPVKTNLYKIAEASLWAEAGDANIAPPPDEADTQFLHPGYATHCVSDTQPIAPKPSVTVSIEPSVSAREQFTLLSQEPTEGPGDRFDEFWKAYPKKAGKPAAQKAWVKAVKKVDPEKIISAAKVYARSEAVDRGFVKFPQGWLNDERFNDPELQPVAVAPLQQGTDWYSIARSKMGVPDAR